MKNKNTILGAVILLLVAVIIYEAGIIYRKSSHTSSLATPQAAKNPSEKSAYPLHKDITTTVFWVGEKADKDNHFISNTQSAWDLDWMDHFGGSDDPDNRNGYFPAGFVPKENPFYFALPYDDFNDNDQLKKSAIDVVYWGSEKKLQPNESLVKNRWIKITKDSKTAYAQWEDVGPFEEDDVDYVFGTAKPKNDINKKAGLDVSPAVQTYLGLSGMDKTDWQFVDEKNVPDGPWKKIITTSGVNL